MNTVTRLHGKPWPLPNPFEDVVFYVGARAYAGYFDADSDSFGFYVNTPCGDDAFVEAERVSRWGLIDERAI